MNYPTKQISLLKVRETEFVVDPPSNVKKRATVSPWQDKEISVAEACKRKHNDFMKKLLLRTF